MKDFSKYLININSSIKAALKSLSNIGLDTILFAVNDKHQLLGSITDGDIRRAILNGISIDDKIILAINKNTKYIKENDFSINDIVYLRTRNFTVFPLLDKNDVIIDIINFRFKKSYLPLDVVIMAGGKGLRLKPLTDVTPKPLLKVNNKCIIDYGVERLIDYGVNNFFISVNYLGSQVENHFKNRKDNSLNIEFIYENQPLGTAGSLSEIKNFENQYILFTNSDIITNINFEEFFINFIKSNADMSVVSIPYEVEVPYAVIKTDGPLVKSFEEKPSYTYFSNGGIYLIKKQVLDKVPKNKFYDATDLMQAVIDDDLKLVHFPFDDYWIDIGKHRSLLKAQKDVAKIHF